MMRAMADPTMETARSYLEASLPLGQWAAASHAIGRDHAYIQQYIRRGVPRWLREEDRDILCRLYDLDAERLKPPAKSANLAHINSHHPAGRDRDDKAEISLHRLDELIDDPGTLNLVWACLRIVGDQEKRTAFTVLTALGKQSARRLAADKSGTTAA